MYKKGGKGRKGPAKQRAPAQEQYEQMLTPRNDNMEKVDEEE